MKTKIYCVFLFFFMMTGMCLNSTIAQTTSTPVNSGKNEFAGNTLTQPGNFGTASPGCFSSNPAHGNTNSTEYQGIKRITGKYNMPPLSDDLEKLLDETRSGKPGQHPKAPTDVASILLISTTDVSTSVQQALNELGYTYDFVGYEDWTGIDFSPYDVVIIAMDGGLVTQSSLLKIRTDVIGAGKRAIFIGGTCLYEFVQGVNQYLVLNDLNNYCWQVSGSPQFTVTQPDHELAQGLSSPYNYEGYYAGYYQLRTTDPDIDIVARNGDNWPCLFYKGDNWPDVKGSQSKGAGDLIWFTSSPYAGYWNNPSDYALLKQVISNSILYNPVCYESILLIYTIDVTNSVKKALNELFYNFNEINSSYWVDIDFSPYDLVIIAMDGGAVDQYSLLKIRTDVIDAGKRVIFIGGTQWQDFALGVNHYLVLNDVNNYSWKVSYQTQFTVTQPAHFLAEGLPSSWNYGTGGQAGYYTLRANDPDIDVVAMNGDGWPCLFYKNGVWPAVKGGQTKSTGDLVWFTSSAYQDYWNEPNDYALLKQVIANSFDCSVTCANPADGGTIAENQTICSGDTPAALYESVAPGGTIVGTLQYQWLESSNGTDFSDIDGANLQGYSPPELTADTWYKRLVKVDCETIWLESNILKISIWPEFDPGAIATEGETICLGSDPMEIQSVNPASGGDGNISYTWLQSTEGPESGFTEIIGFFDEYLPNTYVAINDPVNFTTWDNQPGTPQDALITDAIAHSLPNAAKVASSTDLLLLLGDKTSGNYELSWWMYIAGGESGYYNIQHFEDPALEWAFEVYFNDYGWTYLAAGGDYTYFSYPADHWFRVKHLIDLDNDLISLYIDDVFIREWPFSYQTYDPFGTNQLGSVDFYYNFGEYYFDDVYFAGISGAIPDLLIGNFSNSATYDPPFGLNQTTWYRRAAFDGACNIQGEFSSGTWQVTVLPQFALTLPENWSAISSFLVPRDPSIVSIMQPVVDDLRIMLSTTGLYAPPPFNINTLVDWDIELGYKVKMLDAGEITICGNPPDNNDLELGAGFHIIPVLTNVASPIGDIFGVHISNVLYILDLVTNDLYWPQGGITELTELTPGKGYLAHFLDPVTIDFPDYDEDALYELKSSPDVNVHGPWTCAPNFNIHLIAIDGKAAAHLNADYIGAFDIEGNCIGYANLDGTSGNALITVYGDDEYSAVKDGAAEGETISFKAYNSETQEETLLTPTFDPMFPQHDGSFALNGQSKIMVFMKTATTGSDQAAEQIKIFPNPARDKVTIVYPYNGTEVELTVITMEGKVMMTTMLSNTETSLDVGLLRAGVYVMKFEANDQVVIKRLVVR